MRVWRSSLYGANVPCQRIHSHYNSSSSQQPLEAGIFWLFGWRNFSSKSFSIPPTAKGDLALVLEIRKPESSHCPVLPQSLISFPESTLFPQPKKHSVRDHVCLFFATKFQTLPVCEDKRIGDARAERDLRYYASSKLRILLQKTRGLMYRGLLVVQEHKNRGLFPKQPEVIWKWVCASGPHHAAGPRVCGPKRVLRFCCTCLQLQRVMLKVKI